MTASPMDNFRARLGGFAFGGDYNPEQWPREVWAEDVALMKRAGVNLVTVGVFSWTTLEPSPGQFEFAWLDEVMDLMHANGISVDLATPTMSPPAWLTTLHPEILPVMEDGETFGLGHRLHYDPTSPHYREAAARITGALADRYSQHPALAIWHISNEYGPTAYNAQTSVAFREWLQARYGSLAALNEAWFTRFWSQTYTDWDQVDVPQAPRTWSNPARRLDFKRFTSDVLLECFVMERDIVKAHRSDIPVVTNFMKFYRTADYWRWAAEEDVVALDIYPNPGDPVSHIASALNYDLMRSLTGRSWILMEQAASAVSQWQINNVKRPGRMRLGSYQAIAHGSDSVLFFQWRPGPGGQERFHSAMLPHSGAASRTFQEIEALGAELPLLAEVVGSTSTARVGVLFDWDAWWGLMDTGALPRNDFDYIELVMEHYRPLWEASIATDLVSFESSLDGYDVVVIPNAYLVHDGFIERLERFVAGGGTVICSLFSGVADINNQVRQPAYPGGLRHLIGAYIDEYWAAQDDARFELSFTRQFPTAAAESWWWQESITLESGTALATYAHGDLAGRPAIVENRVGEGRFIYIGTRLDAAGMSSLLGALVSEAGVAPVIAGTPDFVEVTRRSHPDFDYTFVLNHSFDEAAVVRVGPGLDLITGASIADDLTIAPGAVAVVRTAR